MTQAQHTPGPWELVHVPSSINDDNSQTIEHWKVEGDGWEIYNTAFMPVSREEREANARLIAAAPTMYEFIASSASNGCAEARKIMEAINAGR